MRSGAMFVSCSRRGGSEPPEKVRRRDRQGRARRRSSSVSGPCPPRSAWSTEDRLAVAVRITSVVVTTRSGTSYGLDGPLSAYLTAPHWVAAGTIGPFAVFSNQRARGPFWLGGSDRRHRWPSRFASSAPRPGRRPRPWPSPRRHRPRSSGPSQTSPVGARPASTTAGPRAIAAAPRRPRAVLRVPEGTTLVTFTYAPPGLGAGLAASGLGLAAIVLLGLAAIALSRRRVASDGTETTRPAPVQT